MLVTRTINNIDMYAGQCSLLVCKYHNSDKPLQIVITTAIIYPIRLITIKLENKKIGISFKTYMTILNHSLSAIPCNDIIVCFRYYKFKRASAFSLT